MSEAPAVDLRPHLVLTVLLDSAARQAAVTRSHGDALERAMQAAAGMSIAGFDVVELPVLPKAFDALRRALHLDEAVVGLYDVFPLANHLDAETRKVAGQFLAAEAIWTLEEQGTFGGVPLHVKLDLPSDWDGNPKQVHGRLLAAGALELSAEGIETFRHVKQRWDQSSAAPSAPAASAIKSA